jgi:hypothetical protein
LHDCIIENHASEQVGYVFHIIFNNNLILAAMQPLKFLKFFFIFEQAPRICTPYIVMKNYIYKPKSLLVSVLLLALVLTCCTDRFPSRYILELPEVPYTWVSLLGEPHWRLEWIDPSGHKQIIDYPPDMFSGIEIEIPITWTNPVTAWPHWPSLNLLPGIFKPCGALFPFDANSNRLRLSWEAGPDTVFYWELVNVISAIGYKENETKTPANFDWQRFRELFNSEILSEAVLRDPWVVNWRNVAERTIESNFDRRRIVPETAEIKHFPVPAGAWYGTSPFSNLLFFAEGVLPVFPIRPGLNVWVSEKGILRVNGNTWFFLEKPEDINLMVWKAQIKERNVWQKL